MSITHAHRSPAHRSPAHRGPAHRGLARLAAAVALSGGLLAAAAVPANAAGVVNSAAVLATAADYVGTPYRYGGTTPAGFDCSGYTQHVYAQHGIAIPRTADGQLDASTRVSAAEAQPGDLVFFVRGGRAYHVGIFTGDGRLIDSPRSGRSVTERAIWGSNVVFGRF